VWFRNGRQFVRLKFVKYRPIFELISPSESQLTFVTILSLKIPTHLKYAATLPCEMPVSYKQQLKTRLLL